MILFGEQAGRQSSGLGFLRIIERKHLDTGLLLDRLADKWSLLVVELLGHGTLRFGELKRQIEGISQRMLTLTLRQLERDGLVTRTVYPVVPPRVDYDLTDLGRSLLDAVQPLVTWTRRHRPDIVGARATYDERLTASHAALT